MTGLPQARRADRVAAQALRVLGEAARDAYPRAFAPGGRGTAGGGAFWHAYAGLLMLADWLGSDA